MRPIPPFVDFECSDGVRLRAHYHILCLTSPLISDDSDAFKTLKVYTAPEGVHSHAVSFVLKACYNDESVWNISSLVEAPWEQISKFFIYLQMHLRVGASPEPFLEIVRQRLMHAIWSTRRNPDYHGFQEGSSHSQARYIDYVRLLNRWGCCCTADPNHVVRGLFAEASEHMIYCHHVQRLCLDPQADPEGLVDVQFQFQRSNGDIIIVTSAFLVQRLALWMHRADTDFEPNDVHGHRVHRVVVNDPDPGFTDTDLQMAAILLERVLRIPRDLVGDQCVSVTSLEGLQLLGRYDQFLDLLRALERALKMPHSLVGSYVEALCRSVGSQIRKHRVNSLLDSVCEEPWDVDNPGFKVLAASVLLMNIAGRLFGPGSNRFKYYAEPCFPAFRRLAAGSWPSVCGDGVLDFYVRQRELNGRAPLQQEVVSKLNFKLNREALASVVALAWQSPDSLPSGHPWGHDDPSSEQSSESSEESSESSEESSESPMDSAADHQSS